MDKYIVPGMNHALPAADALRGVSLVSLGFLAALLLSFAVQYLQVRIMQNVGQQTLYDLRKEIFERLQRLPMSFFDRSPVGRLVTRVTTDVDALNDLFAAGIAAMANDAIVLLCIGAVMMKMNWRLALATFAVLPLILISTWIFRDRVRDANRRIRTAIARINAFLQEHISGMSVVQLFNRERKSQEQFAELNRIHMEAYKDAIMAFAIFFPAVELFSTAAIAIVFWYGGLRSIAGIVDVGVLITFMQYAQRFFRPIQDLSEKFNILQSAMAACERIFKLLDEPLPAPPAETPLALTSPRGEIEFRNVWFAYTGGANPKDEDWVLRDVSFHIAPGQTIAIVGHTGAGKDHADPAPAAVLRNPARRDPPRWQWTFDATTCTNCGSNSASCCRTRSCSPARSNPTSAWATRKSAAPRSNPRCVKWDSAPCWTILPDGIDTNVSERGATFSVGQRQLVSFARALAHNPRFLILDEATSSVDTKTEVLIREALDRLLEGRTAMVIAHRLSTIQHADRILVFHKGRLREQGSHQQLLALRGIYYRLYQLQYKDQELRASV